MKSSLNVVLEPQNDKCEAEALFVVANYQTAPLSSGSQDQGVQNNLQAVVGDHIFLAAPGGCEEQIRALSLILYKPNQDGLNV